MKIEVDKNANPLKRYDDYWQPLGSLRTPRVALKNPYRRELAGRKLIKCPFCTELLTHIDKDTLVQVYKVGKKKKKYFPKAQYKICYFCSEEIGVKIVN